MKIGIIGGGISGVSAAFWLSNLDNKDLEISLIEKSIKLGGSIDTFVENGFTVEAGPNGFLDSKPETLKLFDDANLSKNLLRSNDLARKRFIMRDNKLHKLPENGSDFIKSKILSTKAKFRLGKEFIIPPKLSDEDETIADFARRRLGEEALDYMIAPMVAGIFAGDPEKMSLKSCFPVIHNLEVEYGGLIKALLKKRKKTSAASGPSGVLTSYKGGLKNAIDDLTEKSIANGVKVYTDTEVFEVIKKDDKFIVNTSKQTFSFDKIIVCSPAYACASFLSKLSDTLSDTLKEISYAPIFVAGLGFNDEDIEDELDGFGYLIPSKENKKILGALYTSSIFPERAPENKKLIRVLMGGDKNHWISEKNVDELTNIALEETKTTLKHNNNPINILTSMTSRAIPQYKLGHSKLVQNIENICEEIGDIFIGGNILYGVGINDCTRTSYNIIQKIVNSFE